MTRNYLSGSIKKALLIVECVGKSPQPLKASDVANITKLERATAFRILTYLTSLGYIFKDVMNAKNYTLRIFSNFAIKMAKYFFESCFNTNVSHSSKYSSVFCFFIVTINKLNSFLS